MHATYTSDFDRQRCMAEATRLFSLLPTGDQLTLLGNFAALANRREQAPAAQKPIDGLSDREIQVLILVARGYTRREIGNSLDISLNTAARHITNIYRKLDIRSSAEAVKAAIDAGLIA